MTIKAAGYICTLIMIFLLRVDPLSAQRTIDVALVEGGSFVMGNNQSKFPDEKPEHTVNIPSFYMAQYELFYDDYLAFTKVAGYAEPYGTVGLPVSNISWQRAVMLCNWLSTREGLDHAYSITRDERKGIFEVECDFSKNGYRLPTEAEWEYAARGGNKSKNYKYSGSNSPYNVAWFSETYKGNEQKPGQLSPNEIGIYDMSGNVGELCWDYYAQDYYERSPEFHPKGSSNKYDRVYRGGTRRSPAEYIQISRRFHMDETHKDPFVGIRVVRTKTD